MKNVAASLLLLGVALSGVSAQFKSQLTRGNTFAPAPKPFLPPSTFAQPPPRTRFHPEINISGNNARNFGGRVGASVEHDFIRNGRHTLTGAAGAGQAFQRVDGHTFKAKPDYNVGVGYKYTFGRR